MRIAYFIAFTILDIFFVYDGDSALVQYAFFYP